QMGSHGPAYYRRYPERFERFTPVCKTNQLENCTEEEIGNTYDNTILYTDYFLSRVIELLKNNADEFETVLFYVSDHGESLGENGLYLHGMPYFLAPEEQTHIPLIVWADDNNPDIDIDTLRQHRDDKYTHDNVFHTILGLLEIVTTAYQPEMDMIHGVQYH
ncbi:MAG TPA: phosphoethanolamine transferase, partial [Thiotrichales bacterium]|nr:phosphoethanolamine transferase [Thiotrichales bacterium]